VLGVSPTATQEEIIDAYNDLSKELRDDVDKLNELQEAFDILTDKNMREEYDKKRVEHEWIDDSQEIAKEDIEQADEVYDIEDFDEDIENANEDNHGNESSEAKNMNVGDFSNDIEMDDEEDKNADGEKESEEEQSGDLEADGLSNLLHDKRDVNMSKRKLKPIQYILEATLDQIYSGATIHKKIERVRICKECKG